MMHRGSLVRRALSTMRAVVLREKGSPEQLVVEPAAAKPQPGPGQARIRVCATSVCYRDLLDRQGAFPFMQLPTILGHEVVGVVDALGPPAPELTTSTLRIGDRVASIHWAPKRGFVGEHSPSGAIDHSFLALTANGGYAEFLTQFESGLVALPTDLASAFSAKEASTVMGTYGTVWRGAITKGRLVAGETVLVTGASGGVGSAAVQLARALGCRVFAATTAPDKEAYLRSIGAHEVLVVPSSADGKVAGLDKHPVVKAAGGVDLVVEAVGGPTFESALRSLKAGGRLVLVGNVTNATASLPLGLCILKSLQVIGSDSITEAELLACFRFLRDHKIRPPIDRVLKLEEVRRRKPSGWERGVGCVFVRRASSARFSPLRTPSLALCRPRRRTDCSSPGR